jgi:hypothetical protein
MFMRLSGPFGARSPEAFGTTFATVSLAER